MAREVEGGQGGNGWIGLRMIRRERSVRGRSLGQEFVKKTHQKHRHQEGKDEEKEEVK